MKMTMFSFILLGALSASASVITGKERCITLPAQEDVETRAVDCNTKTNSISSLQKEEDQSRKDQEQKHEAELAAKQGLYDLTFATRKFNCFDVRSDSNKDRPITPEIEESVKSFQKAIQINMDFERAALDNSKDLRRQECVVNARFIKMYNKGRTKMQKAAVRVYQALAQEMVDQQQWIREKRPEDGIPVAITVRCAEGVIDYERIEAMVKSCEDLDKNN